MQLLPPEVLLEDRLSRTRKTEDVPNSRRARDDNTSCRIYGSRLFLRSMGR